MKTKSILVQTNSQNIRCHFITVLVFYFLTFPTVQSFGQNDNNGRTEGILTSGFPQHNIHSSDSLKRLMHAKMILVKGGTFNMGNDKGYAGEKPVHKVNLNDFYIDKYEVAVGEYKIFCKATSKKMPSPPQWGWIDTHPIVNISWNDAVEYAEWTGKRLPTEAEWEYAARGGQLSNNYKYSGSDDIIEVAWYAENSGMKTHPVGQKKPNELGIYDMTGNVVERCSDWYDSGYYKESPVDNPTGPMKKYDRIIRGGSIIGDKDDCRVTFRNNASIERTRNNLGFRCVMDK